MVGVDGSAGQVAFAREQVQDPRARFVAADAQTLRFESTTF